MSSEPEYNDWQQVLTLIEQSVEQESHQLLLTMLLTPDERDALVARINIFRELLKGDLSQRQISQLLGVGVATITRGSNELKSKSEQEKAYLAELLENQKQADALFFSLLSPQRLLIYLLAGGKFAGKCSGLVNGISANINA